MCTYHCRNHGSTLPTLKGMYVGVCVCVSYMQECVHRYVHIHTFANMNTVNTNTQAILYKWVFLASQIKQTKTCNTDICVYVCRNVCTGMCIYTHVHMANIHRNNHLQVLVFVKTKISKTQYVAKVTIHMVPHCQH